MTTGFYQDERCYWHSGGEWSLTVPVGGWVQPGGGGFAESPESKRRLTNLVRASGLIGHLAERSASPATEADLRRVHTPAYLEAFKALSDADGGELGEHTPFMKGGFEIAALSAGLAKAAIADVVSGSVRNAYALSRPPGHHCLPDTPMGFCLLNNIAIALEAARANRLVERVAVIDWDVHHGNGTQAIYYDRADTFTVSLHQENNFPRPGGAFAERGAGDGRGANLNIPLLPGSGTAAYAYAMDRLVVPTVEAFRPDLIVIACGFDASGVDPLSRMLLAADDFAGLTRTAMGLADRLCGGRLVCVHEGGYSETHVPFCGVRVLETLSGAETGVEDPLGPRIAAQQPNDRHVALQMALIDEMAAAL